MLAQGSGGWTASQETKMILIFRLKNKVCLIPTLHAGSSSLFPQI